MNFVNCVPDQRHQEATPQPQEQLQLTNFLVNNATQAVFWVNSDAQFLYVNDPGCWLVGYSREELLSMTMHNVNPDFSVKVWSEYWRTIKQQGFLTFESIYQTKQVQSFPVEVNFTYLEYYGKEYGCILVRNITKRKQLEVSLQQANQALEARFRAWAETTDAIICIIQDRRFCYINPVAEVITGYKREELLAHCNFHQLLEQVDKQSNSAFPQYQEIKILTKSGEERWLDCSVQMFEEEGKPALLVTAIDITKRKQAELEIYQALEAEKELSEQRAHFVSMASHEFRAPLNLISFSTSLLKRHNHKWTEEKKRSYLDRIQTAVEQFSQLLDGVLIIGKSEAGKLQFDPRPLNLSQFCRDLVAEMQLNEDNQQIVTFVSQDEFSTAYIDTKLLQPILTNLLSNAIKYSPPGSRVNLRLSSEKGKVIFQIKDQGIGIPVADQQRLFEPFHRGTNVGDVPGSGLGLAVVKKLVDIHRGQIFVKSELGVGTTFSVMLPSSQLNLSAEGKELRTESTYS